MNGDEFKELLILTHHGEINIYLLDEFEKDVGYTLPKTYKSLSLKYNGAMFIKSWFNLIDKDGDECERNFVFHEFNYEKSGIYQFQIGVSDPLYDGIPGMLAIAGTGEGDAVCFDYRDNLKGSNPKVVLMIHDEFIEHEDGSSTSVVCNISNSFDEFLDILYEED